VRNRDSARFYLWLGFSAVIAVFVVLVGANLTDATAQISPIPTHTFTPVAPTPTNTPVAPTPTNTPVPPTPTNTPVPPTNTPTPIPPLPEVGAIAISPPVVPVDVQVDASAVFTEPHVINLDFAMWDWGDGNTSSCPPDSVVCAVDEVESKVTGNHTYAEPGVYPLQVTVMDKFGQFDSSHEFVVVYDPGGGFVTGGGWIDSPAGAYMPDPSLVGKATFGFVSKYKRGAIYPTGYTGFRFQVADLNFQSDTYDWLVLTGRDYVKFKGSGFINGELAPNGDEFKFMLWAGDEEPDTFRIKIWYEVDDFEHVVYDNGMDQEIGGGSIVVHTK
jgi:hypothetical protein